MKAVFHNKALLMIVTVCFLSAAGILGGAFLLAPERETFYEDGYFNNFNQRLTEEGEESVAVVDQIHFSQAAPVSASHFDVLRFRDADGKKAEVDADSFIHYTDESLSSVNGMLLTDLSRFAEGVYDVYYLKKMMVLTHTPEGYTIDNNQSELSFGDFLLKTSEDSYLAVSPELKLEFPGGSEIVVTEGQMELRFLENYVVAAATPEDSYRLLTQDASITFQNGTVLDLSTMELLNRKRSEKDGENLVEALMADADILKIALKDLKTSREDRIDLASVTESSWVMPTFIMNPVDGQDGIDGLDGEEGSDGEDGTAGAEGAAGTDGSAGADGAGGNAGASGGSGEDGRTGGQGGSSGGTLDTEVEKFPRVSITDWEQTAGSVKISLKTWNQSTLVEGTSKISIYNPSTGEYVRQWTSESPDFLELKNTSSDEEEPPELELSCDLLSPDTAYRLIVEAQVERKLENGETASGNYILTSRAFQTDMAGFHLKLAGRSADAMDFAPVLSSNRTVEGFQSLTLVPEGGGEAVSCNEHQLAQLTQAVNRESCRIEGLRSDQTYQVTALVKFSDVKTPVTYTYEYQTLKKAPVAVSESGGTYTGYTLTASEYRYFIASAGRVVDEDDAIEFYKYELYQFTGTGTSGNEVDTDYAFAGSARRIRESAETSLPVYLDEERAIYPGKDSYSLKVAYTYFDNEKQVTVYLPYPKDGTLFEEKVVANIPSVDRPCIQYIRTGSGIGPSSIEGFLELDPGDSGQLFVEDSDLHYLTVMVASASSTRQYTYNELSEWKRKDGSSASGSSGHEAIRLPLDSWSLKAGTTYTITVNGFIVMDGKEEAPQFKTLGSIVLTTPKSAGSGN